MMSNLGLWLKLGKAIADSHIQPSCFQSWYSGLDVRYLHTKRHKQETRSPVNSLTPKYIDTTQKSSKTVNNSSLYL